MYEITRLIDEHKRKLAQLRLLIVFTAGLMLNYFFFIYCVCGCGEVVYVRVVIDYTIGAIIDLCSLMHGYPFCDLKKSWNVDMDSI